MTRAKDVLAAAPRPLFAVLDSARDDRILPLLMGSGETYASLYEGPKGAAIAAFGPYLVALPAGSPFLEKVVSLGWGRSWGVFATSAASFRNVRRHFRQFLRVRTEEGKKLYFRFYDPRVMRVFLPTCTPRQTSLLFGDVDAYLMEGKAPETLLSFTAGAAGAVLQTPTLVEGP